MKKEVQIAVFILTAALFFTLVSLGYFDFENLTGKVSDGQSDFVVDRIYDKETFRTLGEYHFIAIYNKDGIKESHNLELDSVLEDYYGNGKATFKFSDTGSFACEDIIVGKKCVIGRIILILEDAEPYTLDEVAFKGRGDGKVIISTNEGVTLKYNKNQRFAVKSVYQDFEFNDKKYTIDGVINVERSWSFRVSIDNEKFGKWYPRKKEGEVIKLINGTKIKILNIYIGPKGHVEFIFLA